ncbi:MAG: hypothetical protein Ct9H300mP11_11450 [Chloroflexota bacterium]|nr:MAG: hypothetical protein Ct9H300mP11_11450 [Chloroflexota bacterium]
MAHRLEETSISIFKWALDYARERDIILADTKLEFGVIDGQLTLIDELLTPDSSRFWDVQGYAPGKSQPATTNSLLETGWTIKVGTTSPQHRNCPGTL